MIRKGIIVVLTFAAATTGVCGIASHWRWIQLWRLPRPGFHWRIFFAYGRVEFFSQDRGSGTDREPSTTTLEKLKSEAGG